jgi:hypothetical protein
LRAMRPVSTNPNEKNPTVPEAGTVAAAGLGVTPAVKEARIDLTPLGVHGPYGIKFMVPEILRRFSIVWAPIYYEMDGKIEEMDEAFKEFFEKMQRFSPIDAAKEFAAKIKADGIVVFETACEKMILVFCYTRWGQ